MNPFQEEIKDYLVHHFNLPDEQIRSMLPDLIDTLSDHLDTLEAELKQGDLERLGKAGHTIKGALLNLGLKECADIAYSIETNGKGGNTGVNYELLVESLREKLGRYISGPS